MYVSQTTGEHTVSVRGLAFARTALAQTSAVNRHTLEFDCAAIVIGLLAGVAGASTTLFLHPIEHLAGCYSFGSLLQDASGRSPVRRAVRPMIGGVLAGCAWLVRDAALVCCHCRRPSLPATTSTLN